MKCPVCRHTESRVIDSRPTPDGTSIRRRRECVSCGRRFTTYETIEYAPLMVIKKDGSRQPFDREKLLCGLMNACKKRPVTRAQMEGVIRAIELSLASKMEQEVPSSVIGEMVLNQLKDVDEVAYIRFASVYQEFSDIQSFLNAMTLLQK
ncbi:MAG: transcriptional regulator NrdR [Eubacteriales bacterium]|nr:transcriptional regulator NrdR [Eubacteriales bacterium]